MTCNVLPDVPDYRDRIYNPTLRPLRSRWNIAPYADPVWRARVKDQGHSEACVGYALSSMVEALAWDEWAKNDQQSEPPEPISPYMLYYYARRYDDIPGDDPSRASTARGGMKAWFSQGACRAEVWTEEFLNDKPPGTRWIANAFETPLGAYFRVDHHSVPDMQAAINETGVIFATAQIHEGWRQPIHGKISADTSDATIGGHAFVIVGYDQVGFWILSSWGEQWGHSGFANLSYADWEANGMDAWIGQLGVKRSIDHVQGLATGLDYGRVKDRDLNAASARNALLSGNDSIRAQQINPYIINLGNDGQLCDSGPYATRESDLEALFKTYLPSAAQQFGLADQQPIDVAVYAHGGLTDEAGAAQTAEFWVSGFFARKIFPIFIMWETGFWETLVDIFKDFDTGSSAAGAGAGIFDTLTDLWDARLEGLASGPGTAEWSEMKKNAEAASDDENSGLYKLYAELMKDEYTALKPRLRLHLVGHSAGAIFHAYLAEKLVTAGFRVDGIYLMAPACRIDLFQNKLLPHYESGALKVFAQFYLTDAAERQDNCATIYRRSLLYLVSNAFELQRGVPLLGMQKFVDPANLVSARPAKAEVWQWIMSPTNSNVPVIDRSNSTSHGNFSSDPDTQLAIQTRIQSRIALPVE
jgi:hypothetical protein